MRIGDLMMTSRTFSPSWYYVKFQILMLLLQQYNYTKFYEYTNKKKNYTYFKKIFNRKSVPHKHIIR